MPHLLIHSMSEFSDIILDAMATANVHTVCEIGAEFGGMSMALANYTAQAGGELISVDPSPKAEFLDWLAQAPHVRHIARPSLEAFAEIEDVDAWVIDGDHNWFTVYHELRNVDALCKRDGKPFLAFLHDVAWPAARRDMYYSPDQIPAEFRQPFDYEGGTVPGERLLIPRRGFRGMGQFAMAILEGGARNGVKTAVDDFIEEQNAAGREMAYAEVPAVFGLGVLFDLDASWSSTIADLLLPYHENKLIASLERNRLENYLTVLDWQDRSAA